MGRPVILKVWIHYFFGDISGNNRWLGHFNGSGMLTCPDRDCHCSFDDMDNVSPQCQYITGQDYYRNKNVRSKLTTYAARKLVSDIENLHHNLHFALKKNSNRDYHADQ